jgi:transcriptional regulator with XRE-family HTH domain
MDINDRTKQARKDLGAFFKDRREQMGHDLKAVADFVGITANTLNGIESGRFAWDIDLQHRLCAALEIKPYFSATEPDKEIDLSTAQIQDPDRYHGFYISENLLLYPEQLAIVKLTHPRLFVRFNYHDAYFTSFEDWCANHTELQWLDPNDKPTEKEEIEYHLTDCWNFLALHEREEDRLYEEMEEDEDY